MRTASPPFIPTLLGLLVLAACAAPDAPAGDPAATASYCDPDDGGLTLPAGLCAVVFADEVGAARHLVVDTDGDVYVQRNPTGRRTEDGFEVDDPGGVLALRDVDGDGRADLREVVNEVPGTGIGLYDGHLYFGTDFEIFRVPLAEGDLLPAGEPESIVTGFPQQAQHAAKTFAFDDAGNLYVNVGAPSNACQEQMRTAGSPGLDPCPQLERQAGIWRFDADRPGQSQADGTRYATGIRNAVGITWNETDGALWGMQHGRDSLSQLWPELFDDEASAELPSEELLRITEGADFGWPYCYHDPVRGAKVLAPEYGGDGERIGRCAEVADGVIGFPAHWAPNDLLFYRGEALGERYRDGLFIAFHGSWNRMPLPQQGYNVVFVPFAGDAPSGDWEVLADGFAGVDAIRHPGDAEHRPTGLAQGPDGDLYVSDDRRGRIWRIRAADIGEQAAR